MSLRKATLVAVSLVVLAVTAQPASAGIQWIGGNSGTQHWGVPTNWHKVPARLPMTGEEVNIGSTANPTGDAWVLFDATDGTGYTGQCYLGRDYNARLDQSGGTIQVSLWLSICGNANKFGEYNLSAGTLEITTQPNDFSSLLIGSNRPSGGLTGLIGPGEMNHTGGQINARYMSVGTDYSGKYAIGPNAHLDVLADLALGNSSTLELLLDSDTDLDMTVGGNATLGGSLVVTGGLTPADVGDGILILSAAGNVSGSFSSITPGFDIELRSGSTDVYLVPEPAAVVLMLLGGALLRRRRY